MQAIIKNKNSIIINGADSSERILLQNFVTEAKTKNITIDTVLDINGDASGLKIDIIEK